MSAQKYAHISFTAGDVQSLGDGEGLSDKQAEAFLQRNEKHIRDRLVEMSWEVMSTLLVMERSKMRYRPKKGKKT